MASTPLSAPSYTAASGSYLYKLCWILGKEVSHFDTLDFPIQHRLEVFLHNFILAVELILLLQPFLLVLVVKVYLLLILLHI